MFARSPIRSHLLLVGSALLLTAAICSYAFALDFVWDEGFHLLAAQQIVHGRTPYIDFCFPQTLLNAYWNALLMRWTGPNWQITHLSSGLACALSAYLMAEFVYQRLAGWSTRLPAAMLTLIGAGTADNIWKFGTCAQAYGNGTILCVAAFRFTLPALVRPGWLFSLLAGLAAGAAAGCTLLTAPVAPVLLAGILIGNQRGSRFGKAAAFLLGAAISILPMGLLFLRAPQQTLFNVIRYQAIFRRFDWHEDPLGVTSHDLEVLTAWTDDVPTFGLALLAITALILLGRVNGWTGLLRLEFYLCGAVLGGLTLFIASAHPTFTRYFVFGQPFLAALGAVGLVMLIERFNWTHRVRLVTAVIAVVLVLALVRGRFDLLQLLHGHFADRESNTWKTYGEMVDKIRKVTPSNGLIYADEHVYFLMNSPPPPGMEFSYSHKLKLSSAEEKLYHIVSETELNRQVKDGRYATVESCKDERIEAMKLNDLFASQQEIGDCTVFWGFKGSQPK